jgi:hypothetical protein
MKNPFQKKYYCYSLPEPWKPYLKNFLHDLAVSGYADLTVHAYYNSVSHFATWLQNKKISINKITEKDINNFTKHHCSCRINGKKCKVSKQYIRRIQKFISYLCNQGIIKSKASSNRKEMPKILLKFRESLKSRGLSSRTIATYEYSLLSLLPRLGMNTKKYNSSLIRKIIIDFAKKCSRCELKKIATALGNYLRFLSTEGICVPDLDAAIPTIAE